jgi:AcrR family transcriptional regulator
MKRSQPPRPLSSLDSALFDPAYFPQCFQIFAQQGYAATTLEDLATGLNLPLSAIATCYSTRQAFFVAMIESMTQQDLQSFRDYVLAGETQRQRLERCLDYIHQAGDYFYEQMKLFIGFYDQQQAGLESADVTLVNVADTIDQVVREVTGLPSELADIMLSFSDGLNYTRTYGVAIDKAHYSQVFIEMALLYLAQHPNVEAADT